LALEVLLPLSVLPGLVAILVGGMAGLFVERLIVGLDWEREGVDNLKLGNLRLWIVR
jgi:hypothetical protein